MFQFLLTVGDMQFIKTSMEGNYEDYFLRNKIYFLRKFRKEIIYPYF